MWRCLRLAKNGLGYASPNPMVGAVVVHNGKIIGEGFHREHGKPHAEVNAIESVKDKSLLKSSTLYVSLEPCSHYGKTPPCTQLIIDSSIPKVVVATLDDYPEVSGRGIRLMQEAGIEVIQNVLRDEARYLNKEFFTVQTCNRPYIYLKWAQTRDGFIDRKRVAGEQAVPTPISNNLTRMLVHKLRANVDAIMVATNTAVNDNPSLTTRLWYGKNAKRIILDRNRRVPQGFHVFNNEAETYVYTEKSNAEHADGLTRFIPLKFDEEMIRALLKDLNSRNINSVLVEGGAALLKSFIEMGVWDEAYVEIAGIEFVEGVRAPSIEGQILALKEVSGSKTIHYANPNKYKIL